MDVRLTPKQEKFVQGLFKGMSQREAYKQSYNAEKMLDKTVDEEACRLAKDSKITARIDQLTAEVAAMNMLSEGYVIQGLIELKERCMQKIPVMEFDKNLNEWIPTGEWKFDSNGANGALEKLGKYLKMFTDRVESKNVNLNEDITNLSPEDRRKRIAELEQKLSDAE